MDGYLVQQPWADLIAKGTKTWDVRVRPIYLPTSKPFYILSTGKPHRIARGYPEDRLGRIVASVRCKDVLGPMSVAEVAKHGSKHLIDSEVLADYAAGRPLYAMVLYDAQPINPPRPYRFKQGAVHLIVNVES